MKSCNQMNSLHYICKNSYLIWIPCKCSLINLSGMPLAPWEVLQVYQANWSVAWAFTRFDIVKFLAQHCSCVLVCAIEWITKNSIALAVINQSAIRGLKRSLLAGLDGRVAYECLDACDGGNLQSARIVYWLASLSNWLQSAQIVYQWMYVVELIAITSDCVSMDVGSVFDDRFKGGFHSRFNRWFDGRFNMAVLGYQPQQSVRQLRHKLVLPALLTA